MRKISIIGSGYVGATTAYALLLEGIGREICLVDVDKKKLEGEALDLQNGLSFLQASKINYSTNYKITKDSDIIVLTAGANQKPGESRLDLVEKNAKICKSIITETEKYNEHAIYVIVANPVDILTAIAKKLVKNPDRVFGSGTVLDTARLKDFISKEAKVNAKNVHAYILGEHGDHSFPLWSTARIGGFPILDMKGIDQKKLDAIYAKVKKCAYEIISKKGATYYAIGLAISYICSSILYDKKMIMPVSTIPKPYGIKDVCLSIPCIVGRKGVEEILEIKINKKEKDQLKKAAEVLGEYTKKGFKAINKKPTRIKPYPK